MDDEAHLRLQSGIYLDPTHTPPPGFRLMVIDVAPGATRARVHDALARIWAMLAELQAGIVRDLRATRDDEPDATICTKTVDALLGYGPSYFDPTRQLTDAAQPAHLAALARPDGPFPGLIWGPQVPAKAGEGDLCLQLTGASTHAANRAAVEVWKLIVDEELPLNIRETYDGFARDDQRSWLGFHDGISNIRPSQRRAAVECPGDPDWNRGGTYLAFLRCQIDLVAWRRLTRSQQEVLVGRDKLTGCALEAVDITNGTLVPQPFAGCPGANGDLDSHHAFRDPPETGDPIIEASHVHRANQNRAAPTSAAGHRIFRQGYRIPRIARPERATPRSELHQLPERPISPATDPRA
ncbi:MAG: Dyp-type peroxidase [Acidimicrobiia bacterium]|nr:Dyp-type peroxidase [Acidimicrobiia bacterium]